VHPSSAPKGRCRGFLAMTLTPPQPRDDDIDTWCSSAKVPDGNDQAGGLGESVPWESFALDGYDLVLGGRTRRSVVERIVDLLDRFQHIG
jgi:hypothetical protein